MEKLNKFISFINKLVRYEKINVFISSIIFSGLNATGNGTCTDGKFL
jgi:hypothetical protein